MQIYETKSNTHERTETKERKLIITRKSAHLALRWTLLFLYNYEGNTWSRRKRATFWLGLTRTREDREEHAEVHFSFFLPPQALQVWILRRWRGSSDYYFNCYGPAKGEKEREKEIAEEEEEDDADITMIKKMETGVKNQNHGWRCQPGLMQFACMYRENFCTHTLLGGDSLLQVEIDS